MIKSANDKEKEILNYIKKNIKNEDWGKLTESKILDNLSDKEFDEENISKVIKRLDEEKRIIKLPFRFKAFIIKSDAIKVKNKIKELLEPSYIYLVYFLSVITLAFLLNYSFVLNIFNKVIGEFYAFTTTDGVYLTLSFLLILLLVYIIHRIYLGVVEVILDKIPFVKDNQRYMIPFFVLFVIIAFVVAIYSLLISNIFPSLNEILASLTIIIIGGFGWLGIEKWLKKK